MEQKQEPQRPKIGTEEVRRAADILRRYHAGKRQLEQRIIDNEQFWKLRHWQQMEKTGQGGNLADPQPTSGWLVPSTQTPWTVIRSPRCCPGSPGTGRRPGS